MEAAPSRPARELARAWANRGSLSREEEEALVPLKTGEVAFEEQPTREEAEASVEAEQPSPLPVAAVPT